MYDTCDDDHTLTDDFWPAGPSFQLLDWASSEVPVNSDLSSEDTIYGATFVTFLHTNVYFSMVDGNLMKQGNAGPVMCYLHSISANFKYLSS